MPKIASAQYDISFLETWPNFAAKIRRWDSDSMGTAPSGPIGATRLLLSTRNP